MTISAYEKQTWTPGSSPLSSSRMDHIEQGIADARLVGECIFAPIVMPGFLALDGAELSRAGNFSRLFDWANTNGLIGTFFGPGDGSTTFTLPDFSDRFPRGVPAGGTVGTVGGSASHDHTGGGSTGAAGGHSHTQADSGSSGSHAHTNPSTSSAGSHDHTNPSTSSVAGHAHILDAGATASAGGHSHSFSDSFSTGGPQLGAGSGGAQGGDTAGPQHVHSGSVSGTTGSVGSHTHGPGTLDTDIQGSHSHSQGNTGSGGGHSHSQGNTGSGGGHSHSNPSTSSASSHSHTVPEVGETTNRPPFIDVIWQIRF